MKESPMKKLAKNLADGNLSNCYLFFGEEKYLINLYENKMKDFIASQGEASMNTDVFWEKESVSNILAALETMPFFSEYRLVIVKNSGLFAAGRKEDSQTMAAGLKDLPESSIILFIEDNVDKRNALYKTLAQVGQAIDFERPAESDLAAWIVREMKSQGIALEKQGALYLIRAIGGSMENISQEMTKLAAYCSDKKAAAEADIDKICTKGLELRVFGLIDALAAKNAAKALKIFENLMDAKESPIMVLSLIARQFRLILGCSQMKGKSQSEIAAALSVPPFAIRECMKQAANFTESTLIQAIKDCLEADVGIKTGRIGDKLALETLIVKYGT
ncbi:MAG: DNA polymerase III subunit delta [Defluviitaleaceae bacterium]|nr:DNA polymerase III subunit delta [Defluviitaleaceae bacterium]